MRAPTGTTTEYEEGIDIDQTKLNGGAPGASLTDGGIDSIDSKTTGPRPEQRLRAGLSVAIRPRQQHLQRDSQSGGYAAWSDKHPAYASVASGIGPSRARRLLRA